MAWVSGNRYLSQREMEDNALMVWQYFYAYNWTVNCVSAMLGNMQSESTINPGVWENLDAGNMNVGYGLVQWTPASKYINWAGSNYGSGDVQCSRIVWEVDTGAQWIATASYPMSFKEFTTSTLSPYYLAMVFLRNYERPLNPNQPQRGAQAEAWYKFLTGKPPPDPPPEPGGKNGNMPVWMMVKPWWKRYM